MALARALLVGIVPVPEFKGAIAAWADRVDRAKGGTGEALGRGSGRVLLRPPLDRLADAIRRTPFGFAGVSPRRSHDPDAADPHRP
ncbi:hypothetical protein EDD29_2329 [Actinocorallia herbida]|uniref:Uncharacterized protein n=1 Tax=Actinocorallia herbida TaxID=58109 RepID=A0A3N1CU13_9ACTN|nr:hypothetical protein EDD29_2329 [Actinocorallia herbida]